MDQTKIENLVQVGSALKLFEKRRSCRNFKNEKLSDEILDSIIKAGRLAPSAHGYESTLTVIIESEEAKEKIKARTSMYMGGFPDPFYGAPHVMLVLSFKDDDSGCGNFNGALVLGNMMLAATALGVGTCWINTAQLDTKTEDSVILEIMEKAGYGRRFDGIGYLVLGYPSEKDFFSKESKIPCSGRVLKV